jgi:hypothetical protein
MATYSAQTLKTALVFNANCELEDLQRRLKLYESE